MRIIACDFESYFDDKYTLRKMTTEQYVRGDYFEPLVCGFQFLDTNEHHVVVGWDDILMTLKRLPWHEMGFLFHHAQFDGLILSHKFGIRPKFIFDTMAMARMVYGPTASVALDALAKRCNLPLKTVPYDKFKGMTLTKIIHTPGLLEELKEGCAHDVDLTCQLFRRFIADGFPEEELRIIDMTARWFTEPMIEGDAAHYDWLKEREWQFKNEKLMELGAGEKALGSNATFTKLLEAEGITVEYKPGKNGPIPAFAKTDDFMQELLNSDNQRVVDLAEARLAIKSSIDQTRAARLQHMAERGPMPIYLAYAGAANTLRWSGGDKVNWQNFRRDGELRKGLHAPDEHLFGVVDKSQVECRFLNFIAGEDEVTERFRAGHDPYLPIASKFYGRQITKADVPERGLGKQLELSCGYGAGGASICTTAKRGTYGPPILLEPEQGKSAADLYRATHRGVVTLWREGNWVLQRLYEDVPEPFYWRDVVEIRGNRMYGPNGAWLTYNLEYDPDEEQFYRIVRGGARRRVWGGVMVQNLMEFLCRINLAQGLLALRGIGIQSAGTIHDEAWFIHPAREAQARHAAVIEELSKSPDWLPGIPLAVEGHLGEAYAKK